ncbi:39S ribosomal protein L30, mitochondrial, partial [Sigmodon hispidus]
EYRLDREVAASKENNYYTYGWCFALSISESSRQTVKKGVESLIGTDWIRHKFTRSRIPDEVFQPKPEDHEKYGGDPEHPHKLHVVTRIK